MNNFKSLLISLKLYSHKSRERHQKKNLSKVERLHSFYSAVTILSCCLTSKNFILFLFGRRLSFWAKKFLNYLWKIPLFFCLPSLFFDTTICSHYDKIFSLFPLLLLSIYTLLYLFALSYLPMSSLSFLPSSLFFPQSSTARGSRIVTAAG